MTDLVGADPKSRCSVRRMVRKRGRTTWFVVVVCTVLLTGVSASAWAAGMTAQREPDAFVDHLREYSDLDLSDSGQREWLEYGEASCRWLGPDH